MFDPSFSPSANEVAIKSVRPEWESATPACWHARHASRVTAEPFHRSHARERGHPFAAAGPSPLTLATAGPNVEFLNYSRNAAPTLPTRNVHLCCEKYYFGLAPTLIGSITDNQFRRPIFYSSCSESRPLVL